MNLWWVANLLENKDLIFPLEYRKKENGYFNVQFYRRRNGFSEKVHLSHSHIASRCKASNHWLSDSRAHALQQLLLSHCNSFPHPFIYASVHFSPDFKVDLKSQEKSRTVGERSKAKKESTLQYCPPGTPQEFTKSKANGIPLGSTLGNSFLGNANPAQRQSDVQPTLSIFLGDKLWRNAVKIQRGIFAFLFHYYYTKFHIFSRSVIIWKAWK